MPGPTTAPSQPAAPAASPSAPKAPTPAGPPPEIPDERPAVESWEDDLSGTISALPDVAPNEPQRRPGEKPGAPPRAGEPKAGAAAKPPEKPAAKAPEAPAKPTEKPAAPPAKAPTGKAALDPDNILAMEAEEGEDLPAPLVEELKKLPAHDLRIQTAKVAKVARQQQARIKQMESELAAAKTPKADPEKEALSKELAELRKSREADQEQIRHYNYLQSEEYKTKYEVPFAKAIARAHTTLKDFTVNNPDGTERPATPADFEELMKVNAQKAASLAKQKFGDGAEEILALRRKAVEIQEEAGEAVREARERAKERDNKRLAEDTQQREVLTKRWQQANEEIVEKYQELFGPNPEDPEENAVLAKGYEYVDKAHDPNISMDERIYRQAAIRHRAAALPREVRRRKAAEARVAELEQALKEYEESAPKTGSADGSHAAPSPEEETAEQAMEREFGS